MKPTKNLFLTALTLAALSVGAWAQTAPNTPAPRKEHKPAAPEVTAADVQALKDAIAAQQQQIQQLTQQVQQSQQTLQQAQQTLQQAQASLQQAQAQAAAAADAAAAAQSQASQQQQAVGDLKGQVAEIKTTQAAAQQEQQVLNKAMESEVTLRLKGVNITPGGYAAAEFVRRSRELGADITTPFNSLTMPGASQSALPEFFGSARQSKATVFVNGRLKNVDLSSYISSDFLSAGVTSTATQTNSYTLRLRQAWAQAKFDSGWSFLGGQAWSLVTEDAVGIAPDDDMGKTNDVRPKTIDPGYTVGFTFARQYGIRLTKDFGKAAFAVAVENAQGTLTTHQNADNFLLGEAGASNSYNTTSNYTANPSPDIIAKLSFDPGFGHYEIYGLADRFADRVFPCQENFASAACGTLTAASAVQAYNASKEGGGIGVNARWHFDHGHIAFGLHGFGGSGVGRYGAAQLSDLSINADGTLHLIKNLQGLTSLELHGRKLDIYFYTGAEYASRTASFDPISGKQVGYGAPLFSNAGCYTELPPTVATGFTPTTLANCIADTRAVIEGTAGFWYKFYSGPKGSFRFGTQYSYVTRQTWSGVGPGGSTQPGVSPEGLDGMIFTSFRYYLP
jgi:hypothetical protein